MIKKSHHLDHGHYYEVEQQSLECCSNGGLFSNFYHTLWSLIDLHNQQLFTRFITFKKGNKLFRDSSIDDLFPYLFKINDQKLTSWEATHKSIRRLARPDHHGVYALYPVDLYRPIIESYFQASDSVSEIIKSMQNNYELSGQPYAAFYYRGTDKHTEVTLPQINDMIESIKRQMKDSNLSRCLVQTDDAEVLKISLDQLPGAFYLKELPVTSSKQGFHFENVESNIINPVLFSQRLVAMTFIMANAHSLTLPVSNLAGWIYLLRSNHRNVIQYNKHGNAVNSCYLRSFAIKNKLRYLRSAIMKKTYYYV